MNAARLVILVVLAVMLAAFAPVAQGQTSVTMKPGASVDLSAPVKLSQVATLEGPDAERLGELVVFTPPKAGGAGAVIQSVTIEPGAVRRTLDAGGVNWAKVSLSGIPCNLRHVQPRPEPVVRPAPAREARPTPQAVDGQGPLTVRVLAAQRLATLYGVVLDDLRLRFVSSAPEDVALLEMVVDSTRRVDVRASAGGSSGRVSVRIEVYKGDRLLQNRTLAIEALVRRQGCVATATIDRDRIITEADLSPDERWVPPSAETPVPLEKVIGQAAKRRLDPGRVIVGTDVRPALAIKKGDLVSVRTLSGGMSLQSQARAMASAREGEMVELRRDGSKKSFFARAGGKGIAVVNLDGSPEGPEAQDAPGEPAAKDATP